eukprot:TRINITY_DN5600_c0_g1_i1.p1 TRINITY_DN5600_c0_g1~~TRINITY_DN5600_c0_g1_i1.p1  ORF type:complete len:1061 (+),score=94.58 TRINITY_DN5600_c0_g1_i1:109-3183(+)
MPLQPLRVASPKAAKAAARGSHVQLTQKELIAVHAAHCDAARTGGIRGEWRLRGELDKLGWRYAGEPDILKWDVGGSADPITFDQFRCAAEFVKGALATSSRGATDAAALHDSYEAIREVMLQMRAEKATTPTSPTLDSNLSLADWPDPEDGVDKRSFDRVVGRCGVAPDSTKMWFAGSAASPKGTLTLAGLAQVMVGGKEALYDQSLLQFQRSLTLDVLDPAGIGCVPLSDQLWSALRRRVRERQQSKSKVARNIRQSLSAAVSGGAGLMPTGDDLAGVEKLQRMRAQIAPKGLAEVLDSERRAKARWEKAVNPSSESWASGWALTEAARARTAQRAVSAQSQRSVCADTAQLRSNVLEHPPVEMLMAVSPVSLPVARQTSSDRRPSSASSRITHAVSRSAYTTPAARPVKAVTSENTTPPASALVSYVDSDALLTYKLANRNPYCSACVADMLPDGVIERAPEARVPQPKLPPKKQRQGGSKSAWLQRDAACDVSPDGTAIRMVAGEKPGGCGFGAPTQRSILWKFRVNCKPVPSGHTIDFDFSVGVCRPGGRGTSGFDLRNVAVFCIHAWKMGSYQEGSVWCDGVCVSNKVPSLRSGCVVAVEQQPLPDCVSLRLTVDGEILHSWECDSGPLRPCAQLFSDCASVVLRSELVASDLQKRPATAGSSPRLRVLDRADAHRCRSQSVALASPVAYTQELQQQHGEAEDAATEQLRSFGPFSMQVVAGECAVEVVQGAGYATECGAAGCLSPPFPLCLSRRQRVAARVPPSASVGHWMYPCESGVGVYQHGGLLLTNAVGEPVASVVVAPAERGRCLVSYSGPYEWPGHLNDQIRYSRWAAESRDTLRQRGVQYCCWLLPGESVGGVEAGPLGAVAYLPSPPDPTSAGVFYKAEYVFAADTESHRSPALPSFVGGRARRVETERRPAAAVSAQRAAVRRRRRRLQSVLADVVRADCGDDESGYTSPLPPRPNTAGAAVRRGCSPGRVRYDHHSRMGRLKRAAELCGTDSSLPIALRRRVLDASA